MAQRAERTNKQMENLPILQDFVPYRGRCPKRAKNGRGRSRMEGKKEGGKKEGGKKEGGKNGSSEIITKQCVTFCFLQILKN